MKGDVFPCKGMSTGIYLLFSQESQLLEMSNLIYFDIFKKFNFTLWISK